MGSLIVIVAMLAVLWLIFIMPQRRRQQAQRSMLDRIEVGDEILTVGGVYGIVRELREHDELGVEIAPGTEVRVARRAVAAIVPEDDEDEEYEDEDEEDEEDEGEAAEQEEAPVAENSEAIPADRRYPENPA